MSKQKTLHLPKTYIELEVRDKDGKLIEKRRVKGGTWVKNFILFFQVQMKCVTSTAYDTSGASKTAYYNNDVYRMDSPVNTSTWGIQVGKSDAAFSIEHYSLQSQIIHGTGVDQMLHSVCTVESLVAISGGYQFRLVRVFSNSSGASITVKEVGLAFKDTPGSFFLIARDLITSITVPNGSSLTVRYIISHTV